MSTLYKFTEEQILLVIQTCEDDLGPSNIRKKLNIADIKECSALYRATLKYIKSQKPKTSTSVSFDIQLDYAKHLGFANVADAYAKHEPRKFRLDAKAWFDSKRPKKTVVKKD